MSLGSPPREVKRKLDPLCKRCRSDAINYFVRWPIPNLEGVNSRLLPFQKTKLSNIKSISTAASGTQFYILPWLFKGAYSGQKISFRGLLCVTVKDLFRLCGEKWSSLPIHSESWTLWDYRTIWLHLILLR